MTWHPITEPPPVKEGCNGNFLVAVKFGTVTQVHEAWYLNRVELDIETDLGPTDESDGEGNVFRTGWNWLDDEGGDGREIFYTITQPILGWLEMPEFEV